eukprot:6063745-Pyramimonas_sp.AAC.2
MVRRSVRQTDVQKCSQQGASPHLSHGLRRCIRIVAKMTWSATEDRCGGRLIGCAPKCKVAHLDSAVPMCWGLTHVSIEVRKEEELLLGLLVLQQCVNYRAGTLACDVDFSR